MRIAYFSPLNPVRSGISDYSEGLLPELSKYAQIDIYVHQSRVSSELIRSNYRVQDYRKFSSVSENYDITLYQMGNSPCHRFVYETVKNHPGILVLHDWVLHHFFAGFSSREYLRVLSQCYGEQGLRLGLNILKGVYGPRRREQKFFHYPLSEGVVAKSLGVIVHSRHMEELLKRRNPNLRTGRVAQHYSGPAQLRLKEKELVRKYGFAPDDYVVGSFGYITPSRRVEQVLRAFKRLKQDVPSAHYVLVGEPPALPYFNLQELVGRYGLSDCVRVTGWVDRESFFDYMAICDLCVNLRYPSAGEVSATLIQLMGLGKPVLVSNYAQYGEFPDDCCAKVDLGKYEVALLYEYMKLLAENRGVRTKMGENARSHILKNHTVEGSAKAYMDFIQEVLAG